VEPEFARFVFDAILEPAPPSGQNQDRTSGTDPASKGGKGANQPTEIFSWLDRSDKEEVRSGHAESGGNVPGGVGRVERREFGLDPLRDDDNLVRDRGRDPFEKVAAGRVRYGDDAIGLVDGAVDLAVVAAAVGR